MYVYCQENKKNRAPAAVTSYGAPAQFSEGPIQWALLSIHWNPYRIASVFAKMRFTGIVFAAGGWQCS